MGRPASPAPQIGDRFSRLVVTKTGLHQGLGTAAEVLCDCGSKTVVRITRLRSGHTKSCGCSQRESVSDRNTSHGLGKHYLYKTWLNMIHRCEDPSFTGYKNWGGRGIKVCNQWHSVSVFISDIERLIGARPEGLTLDRINNDGNYEPGNVRWATHSQQMRNRRY